MVVTYDTWLRLIHLPLNALQVSQFMSPILPQCTIDDYLAISLPPYQSCSTLRGDTKQK